VSSLVVAQADVDRRRPARRPTAWPSVRPPSRRHCASRGVERSDGAADCLDLAGHLHRGRRHHRPRARHRAHDGGWARAALGARPVGRRLRDGGDRHGAGSTAPLASLGAGGVCWRGRHRRFVVVDHQPSLPFIAGLAAAMVGKPWLSRPMAARPPTSAWPCWWGAVAIAGSLGVPEPLLTVALGATVSAAISTLFGAPNRRPAPAVVAVALQAGGLDVVDLTFERARVAVRSSTGSPPPATGGPSPTCTGATAATPTSSTAATGPCCCVARAARGRRSRRTSSTGPSSCCWRPRAGWPAHASS
jgi:hypothetical protein